MEAENFNVAAGKATSMPSFLLTETEAARHLNVAAKTLQNMRWKGGGPRFVKVGRLVRYRATDLDAFIAANMHSSTSTEAC